MSSLARNHIMNYGYNLSLIQFQDRFEKLREVFGRHGIRVTSDHLADPPPVEVFT